MMPTYDSDGTFLPKVSGVQQLRMSLHERLCATTLLYLSRTRTPPSRSQHLDSCTLHDHVGARISLLGRGCGALSAARYYKTRKVRFERFVRKSAHLRLESAQYRLLSRRMAFLCRTSHAPLQHLGAQLGGSLPLYTTDLCQGGRSNDRLAHPAAYAPVEHRPSEEATH